MVPQGSKCDYGTGLENSLKIRSKKCEHGVPTNKKNNNKEEQTNNKIKIVVIIKKEI